MGSIKKKRTEITVETHTVTIIRALNAGHNIARCDVCSEDVMALPDQYAALIFRVNESELELFASSGDIHRAQNQGLCGNSLGTFFEQEIRYIED